MLNVNGGPAERAVVERMTEIISHRGPDDSGSYYSGPVGLGFRRLSILDLTPAGHQPMSTPDGGCTIVFNGEIYNYLELRAELQQLGHVFGSTGDTEVLLHAYLQWGMDCLPKLNGMWGFLIWDERRGRLFGSRDRFGIKPLFRYRAGHCWLFGSEIKAIRASGMCDAGVNWPVAAEFLMNARLDLAGQTFYAGIEQLGPATAFELGRDGAYREWRYWRIEETPPVEAADPAAAFAALFEDSMRLHMRSDVPVGVHLSGGLDSTAIICASARLRASANATDPLMAFCYMSRDHDESKYIADTIAQTGAQPERLERTPLQLWESFGRVLWFQDEPMYSMQPLVGFALMEMTAARGIKVILNGQGADEILAGYGDYFRDYWHTLLDGGSPLRAWHEIGRYTAAHGGRRSGLYLRQLRRLVQSKLRVIPAYRILSWRRNLDRMRSHPWFTPELARRLPEGEPYGFGRDDLNASLMRSIASSPLPLYLRVEDRNSMAHSIETRVPFLDYRLVSFVLGLPPDWKVRGPWNKYVLREGMRGRIPESVRTRVDKMGFPTSSGKWLGGVLHEPVLDLLHSREACERGIYNLKRILGDLERHRKGEIDATGKLLQVIQFEIWSGLQQAAPVPYRGRVESGSSPAAAAV
jgi:asparagine synthase (glutamine-hydrolysing)